MDWQNFILFLIVILDIWLGFLVYRKNSKSEINVTYSLFVCFGLFWTLGLAMFRMSDEIVALYFWNRLYIITAMLIAMSLFHFALVFPYSRFKIKNWQRILIYSPIILIIVGVFIPGVLIKDIAIRDWGNESLLGWGYIFYALIFGILSFLAFYELWKKYRKSHSQTRMQIFIVMVGLSITVVFGATFDLIFILFGNYKWIWLGPFASFVNLVFIGYAIVAHHIMDVKLVMRKYLVNAFSLTSLIAPALAIKIYAIECLPDYALFFDFILLVSSLLLFPYIQQKYYRIANKYFFLSLNSFTTEALFGESKCLLI